MWDQLRRADHELAKRKLAELRTITLHRPEEELGKSMPTKLRQRCWGGWLPLSHRYLSPGLTSSQTVTPGGEKPAPAASIETLALPKPSKARNPRGSKPSSRCPQISEFRFEDWPVDGSRSVEQGTQLRRAENWGGQQALAVRCSLEPHNRIRRAGRLRPVALHFRCVTRKGFVREL